MGLSSDAICVNQKVRLAPPRTAYSMTPTQINGAAAIMPCAVRINMGGNMNANDNQPDWDAIAEKFDLFLPQLAPVGEALLEALAARPGDKILDIASGTGEPALTLARRQPHVDIIGIDAAAGMVRAAQNKVKAEGLGNITFHTMPAEHLAFDRILCRFGVMLFETRCEAAAKCIAYCNAAAN